MILPAGKVNIALGNGDGTFQAPVAFPAKTADLHVEVADLTGDGKLDVIAADSISELFHVLVGNGDGTLQPRVSFAGDNFEDFAVGDFDGDGHNDLAMAISSPAEVVVYFGN